MAQDDTRDTGALPPGWLRTTVGELYTVVGGGTPSTKVEEYWQGDIAWISSADIYGPKDIRSRRSITEDAIRHSATNLVPAGSLIVVTRVGLGKVALTSVPICFSQDSQALIGREDVILPDYAIYYLSQVVQEFKHESRGTTIAGVTKRQLVDLPFFLPPLPEQHRIVAEIETQFTRLEAGVAALKRAQAKLRRYKASVLKAACEGRLTEEWTETTHHILEPVSQLLERMRSRSTEHHRIRRKSKKLPALNPNELFPIPAKWEWVRLQDLNLEISDGNYAEKYPRKSEFVHDGVPFIRAVNIGGYGIRPEDMRFISEDKHQSLKRGQLLLNDILITTRGQIGKLAIVTEQFVGCNINAQIVRVNTEGFINPRYFLYCLASEHSQREFQRLKTGSTLQQLPIGQLMQLRLPIPPRGEQNQIVAEVERRLSVVGELEKQVEAALRRAERLRQAILKHAFEGKLVPQDPADEPASVLLERIKAERSGQVGKVRKPGRKPDQGEPEQLALL